MIRASVGLSVCRSVGLSVCRSVGLSVCRSVGLSVCRSVCGLSLVARHGRHEERYGYATEDLWHPFFGSGVFRACF